MPPTGIRFRPPEFELSPEIQWVLLSAYGPPASEPVAIQQPERCSDVASRLSLLERIGSRIPQERLQAELGEAASRPFLSQRRRAFARSILIEEAVRSVHSVASGLGTRVVFLKFLALHYGGYLAKGARGAQDADLL